MPTKNTGNPHGSPSSAADAGAHAGAKRDAGNAAKRGNIAPAESADERNRNLYLRMLSAGRHRKRFEREKLSFDDIERHFGELLDSGAFLYAFIDLDGAFLMMNKGMEVFLGVDPSRIAAADGDLPALSAGRQAVRGNDAPRGGSVRSALMEIGGRKRPKEAADSLFAYCPMYQREELRALLDAAAKSPVAARFLLMHKSPFPVGSSSVWIDADFIPTMFRGRPAIRIIGMDITKYKMADKRRRDERDMAMWGSVLNSCPGLLCCVVDNSGRLLYASPGYSVVVGRVFRHKCVPGEPYPHPDSIGAISRQIRSMLQAACAGTVNDIEVTESCADGDRTWSVTISPLRRGPEPDGAVIRIMPVFKPMLPAHAASAEQPEQSEKKEPAAPTPPEEKKQPQEEPRKPEPQEQRPPTFPAELLDAFAEPAAIIDGDGICAASNALFNTAFSGGASAQGRAMTDMVSREHRENAQFGDAFRNIMLNRSGTAECRVSTDDGELMQFELHAMPVEWNRQGKGGRTRAVLLTCRDVTLLRRTQEQLERITDYDRSTGMLNRHGMERLIIREMERAVQGSSALSLLFMDIDGFRRMNDTEGYAVADRTMRAMTDGLRKVLSKEDALGRWGGDEFVVLTRKSGQAARILGNSLRETANSGAFHIKNGLSLSIGAAEFSFDMSITEFVGAARDAMASARREGGNRTVLASSRTPN